MYRKKKIGQLGEDISCSYLEKSNYIILERNFYCRDGEVDIIAFDKNSSEIVFIEVKTRTNFKYGNPAESIDNIKEIHIKKCAEYYLYKKKLKNIFVRFDAIEVVLNKGQYKLNHIREIV